MKRKLLLSLFFISVLSFGKLLAQASACPAVNAGPDQNTCPGQCVNLTATIQGPHATTSYAGSAIPYSPYSYTTGTAVLVNIDDVWTPVINLPFCFQFFGNTYTQMVIGSNGLISFNTAYASTFCQWSFTAPIPTNTEPMNTIMGPYHDIDPSIGSSSDTRYATYGTAPCREFVISWYNIPMFSAACNSMLASQQIVLHENTNIIDIYIGNKPLCSGWNGGRATEGIQNATGTVAFFTPGRNATQWTASNDGYRFTPNGAAQYTLAWSGPTGPLGSANPITVCPTTTSTYTATVTNNTCAGTVVVSDQVVVNTSAAGITLSGAQTNIQCNGQCTGSATVTITAGTGPFSYVWAPAPGGGQGTNTATGLCAGVYTCTVSGAGGCTATQTFNITQVPAITATQSQTNVVCFGGCTGQASVAASGGTGTYTYTWAPAPGGGQGTATATGLCAGVYTCTIQSGPAGCTITKTFTITQNTAITSTMAMTPAACGGNNGTASINVSGGAGGYTYNWTPGNPTGDGTSTITGLTPGVWTCLVTDASGCTHTNTINVTSTTGITASVNVTPALCNGGNGSATVVPTGGSGPYTYVWLPSGSGSTISVPAGVYTCTVTDIPTGCTVTVTATITQPTALSTTGTQTNIACNGQCTGAASVNVSGGTGAYSYNWSPAPGAGQGTPNATALCPAVYTVTATDANGCTITRTFNITQPTALSTTGTQTNIACNGQCTGAASVNVSGGTGGYTYNWAPAPGAGQGTPNATALCPAVYTVTATDANGCTITRTFNITQPAALSTTGTQTNITCNGQCNGAASVTVSGGTGGYTYNWSPAPGAGQGTPNATALCPAVYTVTATDANGCTITHTFNITQPSALSTTGTQTNIACNGQCTGAASVNVSGGTGGYTYNWAPAPGAGQGTPNATALCPAVYTVTATDANGCTITRTFNITQPPALNLVMSMTTATCGNANGQACVNATGGAGGYSYLWSPSGATTACATNLLSAIYSVTVTDVNGCTATNTINVANAGSPTATITASTNVSCFGGNNGSATVTASGGAGGYGYSWAPTGGNLATATGLTAPVTYTVTVTDLNGCTAQATVAITQPPVLTATSAGTNVMCNGSTTGSVTITPTGGAGGNTYTWSPNVSATNTATNLAAGVYSCTVTDVNGCTATASYNVTQPTALAATTSFTQSTCGLPNGSACVNASGGAGGYSYSWTPGPGSGACLNNIMGGAYVCVITDANGCTLSVTVNVTSANTPTVSILTSANVTCFGGNDGSATATSIGGTTPYAYLWTNADPDSVAGNLTVGTYSVTVSDANGCTSTIGVTITEPPQLTSTISGTDILCFGGATGDATVTPSGGTGPGTYTYSWNPSAQITNPATALTAGTYSCTITDANGCTTMVSTTLTEPPLLTIASAGFNVTCFGACDGQVVAIPGGGTPNYTFSWNSGCTQPACNNVCAGIYTVTVTDLHGCTASDTALVTEPTAIAIVTAAVDAHCNQSDGSASANANGGTGTLNYQWIGGPANANYNNIPANTYSVIVTDGNGCADTATATVNNLNGVTASLTTSTNLTCFQSADGAIDIDATGGTPGYTYNWSPNVSATDIASNIAAGPYVITVTDAAGCTSTVSVTLTEPPVLTVTATATPSSVCNGTPVQLNAVAGGGTPAYTYNWTPINQAGATQNITPSATATYTVDVTDLNGCTASTSVLITVNPMPTSSFNSDVQAGCAPLCVNFSDLSTVAAPALLTGWSWDFGDQNTSTQQNPNHCYSTPGFYSVMLTVTTGNGCTQTITMNNYIEVYANPVAAFGAGPQPTTILNPVVQFTDSSLNAATWNWSFGDGTGVSTDQNPSYEYQVPDCYQVVLEVTSVDGCIDSATDVVCIDPDVIIYVPNTFTPDGNGLNDVFIPVTEGIDPDKYEMWIFDRWGNMIFYTDELDEGWNGCVLGSTDLCQVDTYVWKIKCKDILDKRHDLIGHVNLIR